MEEDTKNVINIYTDGSCCPNPGRGGWGAIFVTPAGQVVCEMSGSESESTNSRMELTAAIEALESLQSTFQVTIFTDSKYVVNGITIWIKDWVGSGWHTSRGVPVKNQDLWKRLYKVTHRHNVTWRWVRGHSGNYYNGCADRLAREAGLNNN